MAHTLLLGAVAYDDKVVGIWEGFKTYFTRHGLDFDFVLYSNYERQVQAHFAGQIHVAWNSPLAWIQSERIGNLLGRKVEALCMRDTDRDLTSIILVRAADPIHSISDLKGRRVAVGADDSPQSTLIPLDFIARQGLIPEQDFEILRFDKLRGKHGDHIAGEREAARALMRNEAEAACIIDSNHLVFSQEGTLHAGAARVLARTPAYDHCNFTVLDTAPAELVQRFRELLLHMSYADGEVRRLFDLEGLKRWHPGRTSGYRPLDDAVQRFHTVDAFINLVVAECRSK